MHQAIGVRSGNSQDLGHLIRAKGDGKLVISTECFFHCVLLSEVGLQAGPVPLRDWVYHLQTDLPGQRLLLD